MKKLLLFTVFILQAIISHAHLKFVELLQTQLEDQ